MIATVGLLVKNAAPYLPEILSAVLSQRLEAEFEVLAVDSGSTDATLQILARYPVRVIRIPPEAFNHGETRNLVAREAHFSSQFVVYLSQDALPRDDQWLSNLLSPFAEDPSVAGVFSRHIPRPGASPSLVRQLTTQWQTGGEHRLVKQMPDSIAEYEANKDYYIYFSNTSSALRREVWRSIPFSPVGFAEDADWADRALRAGHKVVFEPKSVVVHSHDYSIIEQFRQNVDHTNAMIALFDPPTYHDHSLWWRALLRCPREVWRDWRFLRTSPYHEGTRPWAKLRWALRSPAWHLASVVGGWAGANLERIPKPWRVRLGRQERLKRGTESD